MKTNRDKNTIVMNDGETRTWEKGSPASYDLRRRVRDLAKSMARASGRTVEIYAASKQGGWLADRISVHDAEE